MNPAQQRLFGVIAAGGTAGALVGPVLTDLTVEFIGPAGVLAMGDPKRLGSLGGKALAMYMGTTVLAICFGLLMGTLVQPGAGFDTSIASASDPT